MGQRYKIGRKKHMVTMYTSINRRAGMIHQIKTEAKAHLLLYIILILDYCINIYYGIHINSAV